MKERVGLVALIAVICAVAIAWRVLVPSGPPPATVSASPGTRTSSDNRAARSPLLPGATGTSLYLLMGSSIRMVELDTGVSETIDLAVSPGDFPYPLLARGGSILFERDGHVWASGLGLEGSTAIGAADYMIPSGRDPRVWLVSEANGGAPLTVAEVDPQSRSFSGAALPSLDGPLVASLDDDVFVVQTYEGLELLDLRDGSVIQTLLGARFVAAQRTLYAWCVTFCQELMIQRFAAPTPTRTVAAPAAANAFQPPGAFSPSGGSLAVPVFLPDKDGPRWGIAITTVGGGPATVVSDGTAGAAYELTWSPSGEWLFFLVAASSGPSIPRIGAYRVADARLSWLPLDMTGVDAMVTARSASS